MKLTTSDKGNIGEAAFHLWCAKRGYYCGKAPEKATYDFFLDRHDGKILRVQVKYRTPNKDDRIEIKLKPTDSQYNNYFNYTNGSIDAIAVYNSVTEQFAIVPIAEFEGTDQKVFYLLCREDMRGNKGSRTFESYSV